MQPRRQIALCAPPAPWPRGIAKCQLISSSRCDGAPGRGDQEGTLPARCGGAGPNPGMGTGTKTLPQHSPSRTHHKHRDRPRPCLAAEPSRAGQGVCGHRSPRALPLSPFCPVNPMVVIHRGKLRPPARPSTRPRGRGGSRAVAVPPPGPHRSPCFLRCPQEQAQQKGGCRQRAKAVSCPARLRGHIC